MKVYPVMLNIEGRLAVIIGGGGVACRKAGELIEAGARVRVVSPAVSDELKNLGDSGADLEIILREYKRGDLADAWIVISATDNSAVNREVFLESQERNIFINAVDDPPNCSFIVPSVIRRGDLVAAVSTSGASPSISAKIRRDIEKIIPEDIDILLAAFREARSILKTHSLFKSYDFNMRGELIKKISGDEGLIEELKAAYTEKRVHGFLEEMARRV